jgi:hypothetical protein
MYGDYQADPGYAFRLKQGEDAIMRNFSARGGRGGGDAMKAILEHGQNMASQEFGNYVNRQNNIAGLQGGVDAAGNAMASQRGQAELGTAGQLSSLLANTGAQSAGYAAQGGQALGGLSQAAGSQLANAESQYGANLSNLAVGQGNSMATATGANAGSLADLATNFGANQSNVFGNSGAAVNAALAAPVQYAGGADAAAANMTNQFIGAGAGVAGTVLGNKLAE